MNPHLSPYLVLLSACLALACTAAQANPAFAPAGTKATLTVDYLYESAGSKRSEGMYDPHEWRVKRTVNIVVELVAQAATALPSVQTADNQQVQDIEKRIARCGDDQACLMREAQSMGSALIKPEAMRHQAWRPTAQKGSYLIDETTFISSPDPICAKLPRKRCTRNEKRLGSGELVIPAELKNSKGVREGVSSVEIDMQKNSLKLTLPVPIGSLPYTETITTDEPAGTHDTPTPKGPQKKEHRFRVTAGGGILQDAAFIVPLQGGWRSQSGEQVVNLKGDFGDAGKLVARWQFKVQ